MSSTVFGLSYDARDAKAAASFWAATLGRTVADGADNDNAVVEAADAATSGPRIAFHNVPEGKTVKNRLHLDLITTDFVAELARLKGIGAQQLHEVHAGAHWVTLADPEGNEFDLIEG
jgi:predicted enzyme related to lactoylglutathione lyase